MEAAKVNIIVLPMPDNAKPHTLNNLPALNNLEPVEWENELGFDDNQIQIGGFVEIKGKKHKIKAITGFYRNPFPNENIPSFTMTIYV